MLELQNGNDKVKRAQKITIYTQVIIVMELFVCIGIVLATVVEVGLTVSRYIHVDNALVICRMARHHINQLMAPFLEQLP